MKPRLFFFLIIIMLLLLTQDYNTEVRATERSVNIGIINFHFSSSENENLFTGTGFSETLINPLENLKQINVVDREFERHFFDLLNLDMKEGPAPSLMAYTGKNLKADYLLTGEINESNGEITVKFELFSVKEEHVVMEKSIKDKDIFKIQKELVLEIAAYFNISPPENLKPSTENLTAFEEFSLGLEAYEDFKLKKAYELFLGAIKKDPAFLEAHRYLLLTAIKRDAFNLEEKDKLKDFIKNYTGLISENPDNPVFLFYLGNAYLLRNYYKKDLEKAEEAYMKVIKESPSFPEVYKKLAILYLIQGENEELNKNYEGAEDKYNLAIETLNTGIEYGVKKAEFYYFQGVCYKYLKDEEKMKYNYNKALEIEPDNSLFTDARLALYGARIIVLCKKEKNTVEGRTGIFFNEFRLFLMNSYNISEKQTMEDRIQDIFIENPPGADEILISTINGMPVIQTSDGRLIMAPGKNTCPFESGTPEEIAQIKMKYLREIINNSQEVYYSREKYYEKVFKLMTYDDRYIDSSEATDLVLKGDEFYDKKSYDEALGKYNEALKTDSSFAPAYLGMGKVYFEKSNYGQADEYFNKAIELSNKEFIDAYIWSAEVARKNDDSSGAEEKLNTALDIARNNGNEEALEAIEVRLDEL